MNDSHHFRCRFPLATRRFGLCLPIVWWLALAFPVLAQTSVTIDDTRHSALLAKRPAKLSKPFAGVETKPAATETRTTIAKQATPKTGTASQAAYAPEEIPPAKLPTTSQVGPTSPDLDYVVVDEGTMLGSDPCLESLCCQRGHIWVRAEYLLWWLQGFSSPALVTTSPSGTARVDAGILGRDGTTVLFGDERLAGGARSGLRLTAGTWLNACEMAGIQASVMGLATEHDNFSADSGGSPILARPFFNVEPGFEGQDAELIAYPGLFSGSVNVRATSALQGMDFLLRHQLASDGCWRVDGLVGLRYNRLHDQLTIDDSRRVIGTGTGLAVGTRFSETDEFDTVNQFYGAQLGFLAERQWCKFSLEGTLKVALGTNHSRVRISGNSTATVPVPGGSTQTFNTPAGLLAQASNIGTYNSDQFAVIPELGLTAGYEITPCLRATVGYSFLFWSGVARPGNQIDTDLNLSQLSVDGLVGIARPRYRQGCEDLWAQGLNFGLDYRF